MNLLLDASFPVAGAPACGMGASRTMSITTATTTGIPTGARTA